MSRRIPHVAERGTGGLPVLFLHSLGGTKAHWTAQLDVFGRTRQSVAVDLLGHGENPTPWGGDLSFDRVANDVVSTANHLGLRRLVLVGHSFGGGVAMACAAKIPKYVAGLLMADPIGDHRRAPSDESATFLAAIKSDQYKETVLGFWDQILAGAANTTRERVLADLLATPREVVMSGFHAMTTFDALGALAAYPGLRLSVITPLNDVPHSLHRILPDLPHVQITGTSHWLQMDRPEEFNEQLARFLAGVEET